MQNENPIVSVIIPLFNMHKYLDACIQSVFAQTFESWELLLVDDGSTDDTLKICYFYAKKDSRVKVIHQENAGVSVARNAGLQSAIGTYIVFADGDDLLTPDSLKCRVELMQQSDMGIAGYESFGANGTEEKMPRCTRQIWNRKDAIENTLLAGEIGYQGYLWNKIFSRACILNNGIWFQEGIAYNEDRLFVVQYVMHCKRVRLADTVVYRYRNNPDGAMGSLKNMTDEKYHKIMSEFEAFEMMSKMMKEYNKDLYDRCALNAMTRAIGLNKMINKEQRRLKHDMGRKIREYGLVAIRGGVPIKKKIKIFAHILLAR